MEKLLQFLQERINDKLYQAILSNSRDKERITKADVRPIMAQGHLQHQITTYVGTKVFHKNLSEQEMIQFIIRGMQQDFKQLELTSKEFVATVLISKKGKVTIKEKIIRDEGTKKLIEDKIEISKVHNRTKQYILEEGKPVDFLIDLGVMTPEGRIIHSHYKKFKQINRFLEFIEDILPILPKDRTINIIDFGCGKSYLTFALYYYLKMLKGYDIKVIGLDLKEDVITNCSELAEKYGYSKLTFIRGDIGTFNEVNSVDMVITLHACDTATDYAIEKAVKWGAKVILSVPCCQHEVNKQIQNDTLQPLLKYGIIKERMSALITDAMRANLLEERGYNAQILEFIETEHTPKNLLIRAIKNGGCVNKKNNALTKLAEELTVEPTLMKLLRDEL